LALIGIVLVLAWLEFAKMPGSAREASLVPGPTLHQIQSLSDLTTLRVEVVDAMETELRGYTGQIQAVILVRGDVTVGVDLSKAFFEAVDDQNHRMILLLPGPAVQEVRLDHERTKLLGVWPSGLWTIVPGGGDADTAAINDCFRDAQRAVANAGGDSQIIERARRQAEQVMSTFFAAMGWTVDVHWAD
jgi:hypothetical protein